MNNEETFIDRYKIISHVGRGGMQEVYLAEDLLLGSYTALKTPQFGQQQRRFTKSAQIAAMVNHHNVAKTLDYFEVKGVPYLIEEFVEGETLEEKLQKYDFFDPHLGAKILHYLAKGISCSHRAGVIHRDLKPSNIMVSKGPNLTLLKITDFGIATLTEEVFDEAQKIGDITQSTSGTVKGAIPFMAPEMMFRTKDTVLTPALDIWALGALMFKCLTGIYPFGVFLEAAVNVKTNNRAPWPDFMTRNPQFSSLASELISIIDKCFIYDPKDRISAEEIVQECQNLCYSTVEREEGIVTNLIQNGSSGFIGRARGEPVFFSMKSAYGVQKPNSSSSSKVCFSSFPGSPRDRAHPILVLK